MRTLSFALAVLLLPAPAIAQIYQWRDADGKVHYSDHPPANAPKQERTLAPRGLAPAPAAAATAQSARASSYQEQDAAFKQRQVEREEAQVQQKKEEAEAANRRRNCEMARGNVRNLQATGRQVRFDPKTGERIYLSDDEIAQAMRDAQRAVDDWCAPQTAQR